MGIRQKQKSRSPKTEEQQKLYSKSIYPKSLCHLRNWKPEGIESKFSGQFPKF